MISENVFDLEQTDKYTIYHADCIQVAKMLPSESIHYSIFSPPFYSLYVYSDSPLDMGNSKSDAEFLEHFRFLVKELFRITKPGRLVSFHCMDVPAMKSRDGYIGIKDFPADLRQMFEEEGFIYHSKVTIWKDPLIEATRTKALGLMHKQLVKDSSMCRQGLPDYLVTMRKPGDNEEPIAHPNGLTRFIGEYEPNAPKGEPTLKNSREHRNISMAKKDPVYSHHVWRRYASPVWMDINQTNTLNRNPARDEKDEKHIAPLQLDVIGRAIELWSNPNDIIFTPFMGIGSECYEALKRGRRAVGVELKESYYRQAKANLESVIEEESQVSLF